MIRHRAVLNRLTIETAFLLFLGGPSGASTDVALQMALGNPSHATAENRPDTSINFIIRRPQYALSYNQVTEIPNWVSWHLTRGDIGSVPRSAFSADPILPVGWHRVIPSEYDGTGTKWNRGHMCPAKDRSATQADNHNVFVMSNILPQAAALNQHPWERLEEYSRELAKAGNDVFVICGPSGNQGKLPTGITIPARTWKIIVVVPPGPGSPLSRITRKTRVIAAEYPNNTPPMTNRTDWSKYRTSVRRIEKETRLDFLSAVPKYIQDVVETRVDTEAVPSP